MINFIQTKYNFKYQLGRIQYLFKTGNIVIKHMLSISPKIINNN